MKKHRGARRALIALGILLLALVLAVGVRPNVSLVKDAGGKVNRGIVTDGSGLTSLPDVYAAGDCCESWDITSG